MGKMHARELVMSNSILLALMLATNAVPELKQVWPVEFAARHCEFGRALALLDHVGMRTTEERWKRGLLRARLLLQLERPKEALEVLTKLPKPADAKQQAEQLFISGMAYGLGKDLIRALESLRKAKELGTDPSLVDGAIGMAYLVAGRASEAEESLLRALKDDPLLSGALYNLACVRAGQGRLAEAGALLRQAWHLGLKNPRLLAADPALAPLRASPNLINDLVDSDERSCTTF
jgi:tetratricopeptide (TPR) repeat protein